MAGAAPTAGAGAAEAAGRKGNTFVRHLLWTNFFRMRCRPGPASMRASLAFTSSAISFTNFSVYRAGTFEKLVLNLDTERWTTNRLPLTRGANGSRGILLAFLDPDAAAEEADGAAAAAAAAAAEAGAVILNNNRICRMTRQKIRARQKVSVGISVAEAVTARCLPPSGTTTVAGSTG